MHSFNVVHRDLKPENLLVSRDKKGHDVVKIADFGLSMVCIVLYCIVLYCIVLYCHFCIITYNKCYYVFFDNYHTRS